LKQPVGETATSLREVSSLGQRSAGRTAGKYSNPAAQRGTSRHVQEQGHAFDLRKYEVTGVCLVVHTEEVTGSIPVSPTEVRMKFEQWLERRERRTGRKA